MLDQIRIALLDAGCKEFEILTTNPKDQLILIKIVDAASRADMLTVLTCLDFQTYQRHNTDILEVFQPDANASIVGNTPVIVLATSNDGNTVFGCFGPFSSIADAHHFGTRFECFTIEPIIPTADYIPGCTGEHPYSQPHRLLVLTLLALGLRAETYSINAEHEYRVFLSRKANPATALELLRKQLPQVTFTIPYPKNPCLVVASFDNLGNVVHS